METTARFASEPGYHAALVTDISTVMSHEARRGRLATAFGRDRPAAPIEDAIAIGGALLVPGGL